MARQYSDNELTQVSQAMARFNGDWSQFTAWKAEFERERGIGVDRVVTNLDGWMSMQPKHVKPDYSKPAAGGKVMSARYGGKCADCGGWMPEGTQIRFDGKAHHYPECPAVEPAPVAPVAVPVTAPVAAAAPAKEPREGYFTVVLGSERRTFKVERQKEDDSFMPGKLLISYLNGPDNWSNYKSFGMVSDGRLVCWKAFRGEGSALLRQMAEILLNPEQAAEAGLAYAVESGKCSRCHRMLTVPASIAMGMGPECAGKAF